MKIRYENAMEDLVSFNEHYVAHSPIVRRQMAKGRWGGGALMLAVVIILMSVLDKNPNYVIAVIVGGITGLTWVGLYPRLVRRRIKKMVPKLCVYSWLDHASKNARAVS